MTLKEEIIYSSNYIAGNEEKLINEENEIISESIKNSSVSKFLEKQAKKTDAEISKSKGSKNKEEIKALKELSDLFKEASSKIRKVEIDYRSGDPLAKKEYKKLCKKYKGLLKEKGKVAKTIGAVAGVITGIILLGNVGLTTLANEDIFSRIKEGIKEGNLSSVLNTMGFKNIQAIASIAGGAASDGINGMAKGIDKVSKRAWADGYKDGWDILKKPTRLFKF